MFADIRELISLDDVMEELGLGPNGGLMYCMEYPSLFISVKLTVSYFFVTLIFLGSYWQTSF